MLLQQYSLIISPLWVRMSVFGLGQVDITKGRASSTAELSGNTK